MGPAPHAPGFELGECLYESSRTLVYRAVRLRDGAGVVLKCPNIRFPAPQEVARITREDQILGRFASDAIVRTHGVVPCGGSLALVLEDFGGASLEQWLARHDAPLDLAGALHVAIAVAQALAQVHAAGLVHRDVKPDNILVDEALERVVLADFSHCTGREPTSEDAALAGTLAFMAPEQTGQMNRAVDYRSDYYSLGVTLYALLTGVLPFADSEPIELVHAHLARDPPPLDRPAPGRRAVPIALSRVVLKLMSKSAEERYQSAHGLVADLRRCREQWQARGTIEPFPVGARDVSERFRLPTGLFGRDDASRRLLAALERSTGGRGEFVLLHGPSGIGKSAVVRELAVVLAARRGWLVAGKCEQFERSVPYAPVLQVLRDAAEQLLTLPDERLAMAGAALAAELGGNAQLAVDFVPGLAALLGPQPPPASLPSGEAANRFRLALAAVFRGLAAAAAPLVVHLDDLQWADLATLELLPHLISEGAAGLLWIGTARDEQVDPDHPLERALVELERISATPLRVALGPLTGEATESLVRGAVAPALADPAALAAEIHTRTRGNPFFTRVLLGALHEQGLIVFDQRRGGWAWDLAQIRGARMPDDVGGFLAQQLAALPDETRAVLAVAACIGTRFTVDLLARALESAESRVRAALGPALALGLLVAEGACFAFAHDQIQRGAAAALEVGARPRLHLTLGRLLRRALSPASAGEALFTVVSHFELGRALLADPAERTEVSDLCLRAGEAALAASAPAAALAYLRGGLELLGPEAWSRDPARARALTHARMTAAILCGEFSEGATQFAALLARAGDRLDRLELYTARVCLEVKVSRFDEAVRLGHEVLARTRLRLPLRSSPAGLLGEVVKARWALRGLTQARLAALPLADDPESIVLSRLILALVPAMYRVDVHLMIMLLCRALRLMMLHGVTTESAYLFSAFYAAVEIRERPRAPLLRTTGAFIDTLRARFPALSIDLRPQYMLLVFVRGWTLPLPQLRAELDEFVRRAAAVGDVEYLCYGLSTSVGIALMGGENLVALQQHAESGHELASLHHATDMELTQTMFIRYARALRGETAAPDSFDSDEFSLAEHVARARATGSGIALFISDYLALWLGIFSGDLTQAARAAERGETSRRSLFGHPVAADFVFARALMTAWRPGASRAELRRTRRDLAELAALAEVGPAAFAVRHALVLGALARGEARHGDALVAFGRAVELARQTGQVHLEALAYELAGRSCVASGQASAGGLYLAAASDAYTRWGALARASTLAAELGGLEGALPGGSLGRSASATTHTGRADPLQLAMSSVLRASQALSSEIVLERLLARLVYVVLEAAGGRACYLLLESDGELRVEAEAILDPSHTRVLHSVPLADCEALPHTLIRYVARAQRDLVLDDAAARGAFSQDPCVIRRQLRSVLCTPIVHQGKLIGVLYLEHERSRAAFTGGKLSLLRQLAAQIAISIENARLYHNLNLARDAAVAAERIKSRFLLNISHELRTPLSGIVGYLELLRDDIEGGDPAQLREDLDRLHEAALRLGRTTSNVLELSKLESGRMLALPVPIDLEALVAEVVAEIRPLAERRRDTLTVTLPPPPALLICDRFMLHFCLLRMLENACQFTQDGEVTLRVGCVGDRVRFEILDDGVGIDPAAHSTLFVAFTQADDAPTRRHEGAGVSLAVCKHFCELLDGSLTATSEPGRGSSFVLELPARPVAVGPELRGEPPGEPAAPVMPG